MAWPKPKTKINPDLWDEKKDSYELAHIMGVTPNPVRVYARKHRKKYKMMRKRGVGMKEAIEIKTDERRLICDLVQRWRTGDDNAGRELQNYGIKAKRVETND